MGDRWLAHVGGDADGAASLIILLVVPAVFVAAEIITRRRSRTRARADEGEQPDDARSP